MRAKFVPAYGPWRWFLKSAGYRAITMPWRSIYVLHEHIHVRALRRHELIHIKQIERDGAVRFSVLYLWYLMRHGYRRNPYEQEAYRRQNVYDERAEPQRRPGSLPGPASVPEQFRTTSRRGRRRF